MKKLKTKKGFTLVECVIAMAVLMIMSLLLAMLLNVSMTTRNGNMELERELDEQINKLVAGNDNASEGNNKKIEFYDKAGNSVGEIPANGDKGVTAEKIYREDVQVEVAKFEYDFENYEEFVKLKNKVVPGEEDASPDKSKLVYGAADVNGDVTITDSHYGAPVDNGDGTYKVTWDVSFVTNSGSPENAVKIALPTGTFDLSYDKTTVEGARVIVIAKDLIRIQPAITTVQWNGMAYEETFTNSISTNVKVIFNISKENYDKYYKSPQFYFYGGDGSSASVTIK